MKRKSKRQPRPSEKGVFAESAWPDGIVEDILERAYKARAEIAVCLALTGVPKGGIAAKIGWYHDFLLSSQCCGAAVFLFWKDKRNGKNQTENIVWIYGAAAWKTGADGKN